MPINSFNSINLLMIADDSRTAPSDSLDADFIAPQTLDYAWAQDAVAHLVGADGFVCLGPAPAANPVSGKTWISALPDLVSDPRLSLQMNLDRLRGYRQSLGTPTPGDCLPAVVGVLHYEIAFQLTSKLRHLVEPSAYPLNAAGFSWCLEFDHSLRHAALRFHPQCPANTRRQVQALLNSNALPTLQPPVVGPFLAHQTQASYEASVERIRAFIRAGDCYQANLSQQFEAAFEGSGWLAYQALSRHFPTPQSAFIALGGTEILSLSPEIFINVADRQVETRPIKGTRPRGITPEEDAALARALQESEKDRAENLMIVDLLRNDLGRFCETGSVEVGDLFKLESYANVHHLVSTVKGRLKDGIDELEALLDCFPGGSITGAPKIRAMQIIAELEPHRRGPYCGSIFRWDADGNLRSNIAIRTLWREGSRIRCWGGGGIVHDSNPAAEYAETLTKVKMLMATLEGLNRA